MESNRLLSHTQWMQTALKVAQQALPVDVPVGCLITHNNQLIASAYNCRERDSNPCAHAEVLALTQAAKYMRDWRLTGCTVYVTLEPCPMCASLLTQARVAQVVFGVADALQGACGSYLSLWQGPVIAGIQEAECRALLQQFFSQHRQKK